MTDQLAEVGFPPFLGFGFHDGHFLSELFGLEVLGRFLPAAVGASSHPIGDHELHLTHGASLLARESGREIEFRHLAFAFAHGCWSRSLLTLGWIKIVFFEDC